MKNVKILITSARGKTGFKTAKELLDRGYQVRAFVHHRDDKTDALAQMGAEIQKGDLLDIRHIRKALDGIQRVYFCFPPSDRLLEATTNFAVVAREVGVEAVVNMSQIIAREGHPSPLTRQHWAAEKVLDFANIGVIHIRPTFFADMPFLTNGHSIASEGKMYQAHGNEKHAPVTTDDIARVAAQILSDPSPHLGKVYELTGPKAYTQYDIARILSEALGREVQYVDLPVEQWRAAAASQGLPPFVVEHLSSAANDHRSGYFNKVTHDIYDVTKRKAEDYEEYVHKNIALIESVIQS